MHAQTARIGAHFERSKRTMAAGDWGQDPGEMVIAGVPPALVRWGRAGVQDILVTLGKQVARHMRNEKIPGEAMLVLVGKAW